MDSSLGATAGIAERLLQSHVRTTNGSYIIHLLPALPAAWPDGSVTGLRTRGGFAVDLTWRAGRLTAATVRSPGGASATVRHGTESRAFRLKTGETLAWQ